jgi:hypothetical protein
MEAINITESGVVKTKAGKLAGVVINSHSSGTLKLVDGLEGGAAATGTLTSTGAMVAATHATSKITSSGAMVAGTHAVSVFTGSANFLEGVKASAILTSDQTQPTAGKVVVVGDITYTFVALGTASTNGATACNVALGNNTAETMNNLYQALLSNPKVDTVKTSTYVITVTAKTAGVAGNSIAATEDDSHLDWDGSNTTLTGGVAADTITIGTTVYTPKFFPTEINHFQIGSTLTASLVNLKNAINATSTQVRAVASDATTVTVRGIVPGTSLNTVATTETCVAGSWPDTTLGGGTGASDAGVTTGAATVTIGTTVYTVVDELSETYGATAVAYQVKKGAAEANMLDNLKLAINGGAGVGTLYSTGTVAHPDVIATANTDTTQIIVARTVGGDDFTTAINALPTTETMANTAWADSTLGGGTGDSNPAVTTAAATFTIGTRTYTFVTELSETSGASAVADQVYYVTSVPVALDNMKLAINQTGIAGTNYSTGTYKNADVIATTNANDSQVVVARKIGTGGNAIVTTDTLANTAWGAGTLASGTGLDGEVICNTITFSAVATTGERFIPFYDTDFNNGLYVTIGGTADITLFVD